jgi:hypothetical protein
MPKVVGWISIVTGSIAIIVGVAVYFTVRSQLSDEKITVSEDAPFLQGHDVTGPFTAYAEAQAISKHALKAGNGKTYAELPQDDPNRQTVMTADFLQASLYTSVVAFGVSFLIAFLGAMFVLLGLTLHELDRRTHSRAAPDVGDTLTGKPAPTG